MTRHDRTGWTPTVITILAAAVIPPLIALAIAIPTAARHRADVARQTATADRLHAEVATLTDTSADTDRLAAAQTAAQLAVPDQPHVVDVLAHLQDLAELVGVTIDAIDTAAVDPDRLAATPLADPTVTVDAVSVAVTGPHVAILQLIDLLEDPAVTPRSIIWRDLTMAAEAAQATATLTGWIVADTS